MTRVITAGRLRDLLHYEPETGVFTCCHFKRVLVGDAAGSLQGHGYRGIMIDGTRYPAHRLAFFYMLGRWPVEDVDHINTIKDDNRLINLRPATRSQNNMNARRRADNTSGFKCVGWKKHRSGRGAWEARIKTGGKKVFLGYFDDPAEAHATYAVAARHYFGEFARLA